MLCFIMFHLPCCDHVARRRGGVRGRGGREGWKGGVEGRGGREEEVLEGGVLEEGC